MSDYFYPVTYDEEAEMGYIYLMDPGTYSIEETEELVHNPIIVLDFGEGNRVVGIELAGEVARKLLPFTKEKHPFVKEIDRARVSHVLMLEDCEYTKVVTVGLQKELELLFAGSDDQKLVGIRSIMTK